MAYVKTVWEIGDTITAAKLNNAEGGIEALQPLDVIVSFTPPSTSEISETYSDILAAIKAGRRINAVFDLSTSEAHSPLYVTSYPKENETGNIELSSFPSITSDGVFCITVSVASDDTIVVNQLLYPSN